MGIELLSCPACGAKNASQRRACLSCGTGLRYEPKSPAGLVGGVKNFLGGLFHSKKAIICFGKEFFETGIDSEAWHAHKLDDNQHSNVLRDFEQKGLVFSAEQTSTHRPDLGDCPECLLMYSYVVGFWNYVTGTRLPSPRMRRWKVSATSGAVISTLLNADLARGTALYEASEGKKLLEMSGANLDLNRELIRLSDLKYVKDLRAVPIYQVSYLAMYDKARRLGFDDVQAQRYAFGRGNVYTFLSVLVLRNDTIVM
jgi:hypothetical protein